MWTRLLSACRQLLPPKQNDMNIILPTVLKLLFSGRSWPTWWNLDIHTGVKKSLVLVPGTSWISGRTSIYFHPMSGGQVKNSMLVYFSLTRTSYLVTGQVKILMDLPGGQVKIFRFFLPLWHIMFMLDDPSVWSYESALWRTWILLPNAVRRKIANWLSRRFIKI